MLYKNYYLWLDTWVSKRCFEVYLRYNNLSTCLSDCFGFAVELLPRHFRLRYDFWLCRFYLSLWLFGFWLDFPRMKMLNGSLSVNQLHEKKLKEFKTSRVLSLTASTRI